MRIYTLGYGKMSFKEFLKAIKENNIEVVVDVRRFPTSKNEDFKGENLSRKLRKSGISYVHIEELGGFRGGYERYMRGEEFARGMEKLVEIAMRKTSVIVCVEENPAGCHRKYIARKLEDEGWEVIHLRKISRSRRRL